MVDIVNNWPYTNLHNMNEDWILGEIKRMGIKLDQMDLFFPHVSTWNGGEWDMNHAYQMNEIVTNGNDIYIAKKNVPADENINNTDYWLLIGTVADMSNKVSKAGDTMTGSLLFTNTGRPVVKADNIDITAAPASDQRQEIIVGQDINGNVVSLYRAAQLTSGAVGTEFNARRVISGVTLFNGITLLIEADGTRRVSVSEPAVWKKALGLEWTSAANWAGAVSNALMDIMISFSFTVGTSNVILNIVIPVNELDNTKRFHFSQTGHVSGTGYYAQARCDLTTMDYSGVYDDTDTQVTSGVTTSIYYR